MKSFTDNIIEDLWYGNVDPLNIELNSLCEVAIFQCGFKLGAQMMLAMIIE